MCHHGSVANPIPGGQVGQHVRDREVERLDLLALHPARAVGQDDEVQRAAGDAAPRHPRIRPGLGHPRAFGGRSGVVRYGRLPPGGIGAGHDADGLGEASGIERLANQASKGANDEFGGPTAAMNASSVGSVQV
jgi:hypothetical protein